MTSESKQPARDVHSSNTRAAVTRRDALRVLSALGGAVFGSLVLPPRWDAPRLEFGVLPAHAECSTTKYYGCTPAAGSMSQPFDASSPAKATFSVEYHGLVSGAQFAVTVDRSTKLVTISGNDSSSSVSSASLGTVSNGALTYTLDATQPPAVVNLYVGHPAACQQGFFRATVDVQIAFDGAQGYTLLLRNLTTPGCSYN